MAFSTSLMVGAVPDEAGVNVMLASVALPAVMMTEEMLFKW